MNRTPRVTAKQVIAALDKVGFALARVRGSHYFLRNKNGRTTVVPMHPGETIGPGLLLKILRDCDLTAEQFEKLL